MGDRVESAPVVMLRPEDDLLRWRVEFQTRHGDVQYFDTGRITLDTPEHCTRINVYAENQDSQFPEPGVFYDLQGPPSFVIRNPPPRSELGDVLGRFRASVAARPPPPVAIGDDERMLCSGVAIAAGSSNRASLDLDVLSLDGERWGKARSKFSRKIDVSHLVYVPLTVLADIPVMLASPLRPSSTMRIFSSGENFLRVRRRISRTAASLDCFLWFVISTRSLGSQTPECVS
jgi:hypothetical protein